MLRDLQGLFQKGDFLIQALRCNVRQTAGLSSLLKSAPPRFKPSVTGVVKELLDVHAQARLSRLLITHCRRRGLLGRHEC